MQDVGSGATHADAARWLLTQHPELIDEWLTGEQAEVLNSALAGGGGNAPPTGSPSSRW